MLCRCVPFIDVVTLVAPVSAQEQTPPPMEPVGFRAVLADIVHDLWHLPSKDTGIVLGLGGALALAVSPADHRITADASRPGALEETLDSGALVGGDLVQVGGALGTYLIGRIAGHSPVQHLGADLVRAQAVSGVLTQGLKLAVGRTRPDGSSFSFPSGHSSATFATAEVLRAHFGWGVGIPAYATASYVAASRLTENRHYASDVIFGAAIGMVSARTVMIGHGSTRFTLTPAPTRGGAALLFTHVSDR